MVQQYFQKYTVVCFFEPQENLSNFSALDWPLHVTILDTFKTEWQLSQLCESLGNAALHIAPFDAIPTQKALLGESKDVPVQLLSLEGGMSALHYDLMQLAGKDLFIFNTPAFVGDGFLPHATDQNDGKLEIGQDYYIESVSLVDMFPDSDHTRRRVIDTFSFKEKVS